ncbi:unnamed protein product [Caenorhabditis angaria]|uniref:VWFA domain-containing protein n=1 Tax=Caenorhabditis angaria TaxID=860376 RepID=A0A9P1J5V8_9PELO|nr:unnamed protein product [Caenorhabditis angaria]
MLFKTGILLLLIFTTGVQSACNCFQTTETTGKSASLNNAFDTSSFNACYLVPCGFIAYSGDDTVGWSSISITWNTVTDSTAALTIYDGTNETATVIATVKPGSSPSPVTANFQSSTPRIFVKYTQTITTSGNIYYGTVQAAGGLAVPTTPGTTTVAPSTRTYIPGTFTRDPQLISHDILIVVNPKNPNGLTGLTALNTLVGQFVDQLAITSSNSTFSQSRLALATVTPYSPYSSIQGTIWGLTAASLKASLPQAGISVDGDINSALKTLLTTAFNVDDSISATRTNVQRTILLFTADWPSAATLDDTVKNAFLAKGVNLGVISYNLADVTPLNDVSRWYNFRNLASTDLTAVAQFVNPFFFNDKSVTNYWCPLGAIANSTSPGYTYFQEPSNYNGPCSVNPGVACTTAWTTAYDWQSALYCNFQDSTYTYTNANPGNVLTVTVFYELEVEKDYLRFYADDVEIESFTGVDVYSSTFQTTATTLRARFTTDNQAVYRGFYVQIQQS